MIRAFLLCAFFLVSPITMAACEVQIHNQTERLVKIDVRYDIGLQDTLMVEPSKSLFIHLYYTGRCHQTVKTLIRHANGTVIFDGHFHPGDRFNIIETQGAQ